MPLEMPKKKNKNENVAITTTIVLVRLNATKTGKTVGLRFELQLDKDPKLVLTDCPLDHHHHESLDILQGSLQPGLILDTINDIDVHECLTIVRRRQDDLESAIRQLMAQQRPCRLIFRKPNLPLGSGGGIKKKKKKAETTVLCRLCESTIETHNLEQHRISCIMISRAQVIVEKYSKSLHTLGRSIRKQRSLEEETPKVYPVLERLALASAGCNMQMHYLDYSPITRCGEWLEELESLFQSTQAGSGSRETTLTYMHELRRLIEGKKSAMRSIHTSQLLLFQNNDIHISDSNDARTDTTQGLPQLCRSLSMDRYHRMIEIQNQRHASNHRRIPTSSDHHYHKVSIQDFDILKPISKGAYGKIYLAKKITTGDRYAIKVIAKEHVLRKKLEFHHIETEKSILASTGSSPFVVELFWTFQTKRNWYLVMEYIPGGDLMSLLDEVGCLEESVAKIYVAEIGSYTIPSLNLDDLTDDTTYDYSIVLALRYLHSKGCVHRGRCEYM